MISLVLFVWFGCKPDVVVVDPNLIDVTDFRLASQESDSHPEHRPSDVDCSPSAFFGKNWANLKLIRAIATMLLLDYNTLSHTRKNDIRRHGHACWFISSRPFNGSFRDYD